VTPEALRQGPPPGAWREDYRQTVREAEGLFPTVLVALSANDRKEHALALGIEVARREGGRLVGLHVAPARRDAWRERQDAFERRCAAAGVEGQWIVDPKGAGVAGAICARSRWAHLTVVHLAHPPGNRPIARLGSGFRTLIQRCATPILAVRHSAPQVERALLAYDGSPRAEEALYVSAYLAGRWRLELTVLTAGERVSATLSRAQAYLEAHGVRATCLTARGAAGPAILDRAREEASDLIVMGGYGRTPVLEIALGSTVDAVLRESRVPVLVCR
jgi:nucleotide-binding universal stress UspA family protein